MYFIFQNEIPYSITRTLKQGVRYEINETEDIRTEKQHRALFGWYYEQMIDAFRRKNIIVTKDQVHFFVKTMIPKKRKKCAITGKSRTEQASTKALSKKQFSQLIDKMKEFALHTLDTVMIDPKDDSDLEFYDKLI